MPDQEIRAPFTLNGSLPQRIVVGEVTPEGHATRLFAVVADHGWAERILASNCYAHDARDIAAAVGKFLDVPVEDRSS